jgi:hypothetical protein
MNLKNLNAKTPERVSAGRPRGEPLPAPRNARETRRPPGAMLRRELSDYRTSTILLDSVCAPWVTRA